MEEILIILLLTLFNSIFALAEIAIIYARKSTLTNLEKEGNRGAAMALKLAEDPSKFLSTVQIGMTLIAIMTGIYSGASLSGKLAAVFISFGIDQPWIYPVSQVIIIICATFVNIVLGELVPKRIALSLAEKTACNISRPMFLVAKITAPFVWVLTKSTEGITHMLGVKDTESKVTEEDIKTMVQEGREDGEVQEVEQDIVERVFMLGDQRVSTIMTHRSDVECLDVTMSTEEIKQTLNEDLYEAYPVTDRGMDNILGVVLMKDLIFHLNEETIDLHKLMRPAVYFYENMSVYKALEQMKEKRLKQAFICDEFGCFQGIVTLRDILEGLVGNIDEVAEEPEIIKRDGSESWLVDGQCSFYDFLAHFDREDLFDNTLNYNTLAGLLIEQMKHIPQSGEKTKWHEFNFEIVDMDGARIDKVLVTIDEKPKEEKEEEKEEE